MHDANELNRLLTQHNIVNYKLPHKETVWLLAITQGRIQCIRKRKRMDKLNALNLLEISLNSHRTEENEKKRLNQNKKVEELNKDYKMEAL